MLLIRAVSLKGRPVGPPLTARFGEAGGTIGRGDNNTLVLPDPERFISRTHATISFQAGGFIITDTGTKNPVVLNGRSLGAGSQARLGDGDHIKLGDYILEVALEFPAPAPGGPVPKPNVASKEADPFADLLLPPEPAAPRAKPVALPDAEPVPPAQPPRIPDPLTSDPLAGLRGREPSIDDIFDLKSPRAVHVPETDFLAPKVGGQKSGGVVDPLDILAGIAKPVPPPSVPDHGEEIFTPYAPPAAKAEAAPKAEAAAKAEAPAKPETVAKLEPKAKPTPPTDPRPTTAPTIDPDLVRAFLQGAGIPDAPLAKTLSPELMHLIGTLLREAVQGTLDLLRARGLTKSELRADVTSIMPVDNNPLKFSPTPETALAHLLAPPVRGFLTPVRAMQASYDDLRAHQFGFLAGMRAALEEVLARFAPNELEKRLEESAIDSLVPMNRKARLWDLFVERYEDVTSEAREDFNAAFGKAFLRAYEAQVKQLRAER